MDVPSHSGEVTGIASAQTFVEENRQMHLGFQFHFAPARSTPDRLIDDVADRMLSDVLVAKQFDSFMPNRGAIDGWIGVIYREESSVTPQEHREFIEWVEALPVDAVAHIGDLEDTDALDTVKAITGRIVRIEGCSAVDREEARVERAAPQSDTRGAESNGDEQDGDGDAFKRPC